MNRGRSDSRSGPSRRGSSRVTRREVDSDGDNLRINTDDASAVDHSHKPITVDFKNPFASTTRLTRSPVIPTIQVQPDVFTVTSQQGSLDTRSHSVTRSRAYDEMSSSYHLHPSTYIQPSTCVPDPIPIPQQEVSSAVHITAECTSVSGTHKSSPWLTTGAQGASATASDQLAQASASISPTPSRIERSTLANRSRATPSPFQPGSILGAVRTLVFSGTGFKSGSPKNNLIYDEVQSSPILHARTNSSRLGTPTRLIAPVSTPANTVMTAHRTRTAGTLFNQQPVASANGTCYPVQASVATSAECHQQKVALANSMCPPQCSTGSIANATCSAEATRDHHYMQPVAFANGMISPVQASVATSAECHQQRVALANSMCPPQCSTGSIANATCSAEATRDHHYMQPVASANGMISAVQASVATSAECHQQRVALANSMCPPQCSTGSIANATCSAEAARDHHYMQPVAPANGTGSPVQASAATSAERHHQMVSANSTGLTQCSTGTIANATCKAEAARDHYYIQPVASANGTGSQAQVSAVTSAEHHHQLVSANSMRPTQCSTGSIANATCTAEATRGHQYMQLNTSVNGTTFPAQAQAVIPGYHGAPACSVQPEYFSASPNPATRQVQLTQAEPATVTASETISSAWYPVQTNNPTVAPNNSRVEVFPAGTGMINRNRLEISPALLPAPVNANIQPAFNQASQTTRATTPSANKENRYVPASNPVVLEQAPQTAMTYDPYSTAEEEQFTYYLVNPDGTYTELSQAVVAQYAYTQDPSAHHAQFNGVQQQQLGRAPEVPQQIMHQPDPVRPQPTAAMNTVRQSPNSAFNTHPQVIQPIEPSRVTPYQPPIIQPASTDQIVQATHQQTPETRVLERETTGTKRPWTPQNFTGAPCQTMGLVRQPSPTPNRFMTYDPVPQATQVPEVVHQPAPLRPLGPPGPPRRPAARAEALYQTEGPPLNTAPPRTVPSPRRQVPQRRVQSPSANQSERRRQGVFGQNVRNYEQVYHPETYGQTRGLSRQQFEPAAQTRSDPPHVSQMEGVIVGNPSQTVQAWNQPEPLSNQPSVPQSSSAQGLAPHWENPDAGIRVVGSNPTPPPVLQPQQANNNEHNRVERSTVPSPMEQPNTELPLGSGTSPGQNEQFLPLLSQILAHNTQEMAKSMGQLLDSMPTAATHGRRAPKQQQLLKVNAYNGKTPFALFKMKFEAALKADRYTEEFPVDRLNILRNWTTDVAETFFLNLEATEPNLTYEIAIKAMETRFQAESNIIDHVLALRQIKQGADSVRGYSDRMMNYYNTHIRHINPDRDNKDPEDTLKTAFLGGINISIAQYMNVDKTTQTAQKMVNSAIASERYLASMDMINYDPQPKSTLPAVAAQSTLTEKPSRRANSGTSGQSERTACEHCGKIGHSSSQCWYKQNEDAAVAGFLAPHPHLLRGKPAQQTDNQQLAPAASTDDSQKHRQNDRRKDSNNNSNNNNYTNNNSGAQKAAQTPAPASQVPPPQQVQQPVQRENPGPSSFNQGGYYRGRPRQDREKIQCGFCKEWGFHIAENCWKNPACKDHGMTSTQYRLNQERRRQEQEFGIQASSVMTTQPNLAVSNAIPLGKQVAESSVISTQHGDIDRDASSYYTEVVTLTTEGIMGDNMETCSYYNYAEVEKPSPSVDAHLTTTNTTTTEKGSDETKSLPDHRMYCEVTIDGKTVRALVDTGSMATVMSRKLFDSVHSAAYNLKPSALSGKGFATAIKVPFDGQFMAPATVCHNTEAIMFQVTSQATADLVIGIDAYRRFHMGTTGVPPRLTVDGTRIRHFNRNSPGTIACSVPNKIEHPPSNTVEPAEQQQAKGTPAVCNCGAYKVEAMNPVSVAANLAADVYLPPFSTVVSKPSLETNNMSEDTPVLVPISTQQVWKSKCPPRGAGARMSLDTRPDKQSQGSEINHEPSQNAGASQILVEIGSLEVYKQDDPGDGNNNNIKFCTCCGKTGHTANQCKKKSNPPLQGVKPRCSYCLKPFHTADKCWKNPNATTYRAKPGCEYCNKISHTADKCPKNPNTPYFKPVCTYCHKPNHTADECFKNPDAASKPKPVCSHCHKRNHTADKCWNNPNSTMYGANPVCQYCSKTSHTTAQCWKNPSKTQRQPTPPSTSQKQSAEELLEDDSKPSVSDFGKSSGSSDALENGGHTPITDTPLDSTLSPEPSLSCKEVFDLAITETSSDSYSSSQSDERFMVDEEDISHMPDTSQSINSVVSCDFGQLPTGNAPSINTMVAPDEVHHHNDITNTNISVVKDTPGGLGQLSGGDGSTINTSPSTDEVHHDDHNRDNTTNAAFASVSDDLGRLSKHPRRGINQFFSDCSLRDGDDKGPSLSEQGNAIMPVGTSLTATPRGVQNAQAAETTPAFTGRRPEMGQIAVTPITTILPSAFQAIKSNLVSMTKLLMLLFLAIAGFNLELSKVTGRDPGYRDPGRRGSDRDGISRRY